MANFWSNVSVQFQSALATAVAISAISKANPAVVTTAGTTPNDGDFVLIRAEGMNQVEGLVARVANSEASPESTFELEGIDSTLYSDFTSGTFEVITFGNSLTTITDFSGSGGEAEFADITTIHDSTRKEVPTVFSPAAYDLTSLYTPGNAGLSALQAASVAKATRAFKFTFSDGSIVCFDCYPSAANIPGGTAQEAVTTSISLRGDGNVVAYAA